MTLGLKSENVKNLRVDPQFQQMPQNADVVAHVVQTSPCESAFNIWSTKKCLNLLKSVFENFGKYWAYPLFNIPGADEMLKKKENNRNCTFWGKYGDGITAPRGRGLFFLQHCHAHKYFYFTHKCAQYATWSNINSPGKPQIAKIAFCFGIGTDLKVEGLHGGGLEAKIAVLVNCPIESGHSYRHVIYYGIKAFY